MEEEEHGKKSSEKGIIQMNFSQVIYVCLANE